MKIYILRDCDDVIWGLFYEKESAESCMSRPGDYVSEYEVTEYPVSEGS